MFPLRVFEKRSHEKERMDSPDADADVFARSFTFIRFINQCCGGTRAMIKALVLSLCSWPKGKPVHILDAGCGDGNMALPLVRWGKRKGYHISYQGADRNASFIKRAKERIKDKNITFMTADIFDPDLPEADIIISSMVFHHFEERDVEKALSHLLGKTRHALIINDLIRSPVSYILCYFLSLFVKDDVCQNDSLLSVKKGFTTEEIKALLHRLKVRGIIKKMFGRRFILIVPKNEPKTGLADR